MPKKRNPFLLEHIEGRSSVSLGAFVGAAAAMRSAPFSNSIAVGTEGVRSLHSAVRASCDVLDLARLTVLNAEPRPDAMLAQTRERYAVATALANQRIRESGVSFRAAHHEIGAEIADEIERSTPVDQGLRAALHPDTLREISNFGGGPGVLAHKVAVETLNASIRELGDSISRLEVRWSTAKKLAGEAVVALMSQAPKAHLSAEERNGCSADTS